MFHTSSIILSEPLSSLMTAFNGGKEGGYARVRGYDGFFFREFYHDEFFEG
jgi:hypothetical protein